MDYTEPEIPTENIKVITDKTRILILKILNKRRHTLSELSKILNLSRLTVIYHTRILEDAGYIRKIDDGRKWIYYELTESGKSVLKWKKVKIIIPVATIVVITAISFLELIKYKEKAYSATPKAMGADLTWLFILTGALCASLIIAAIYLFRRKIRKRAKLSP